MRVTDEMIIAAADVMACSPQSTWVDMARAALTAALTGMPEPHGRPEFKTRALVAEQRIAELEARLLEAREVASTLPSDVDAHKVELVRILDGEGGT